MKCQKCNYDLVLLPNRGKYKCALCSKLYFKKEAESKEFRILNQKQRELDEFNTDVELNQRLNEFKATKKALKLLFKVSERAKSNHRKDYYLRNKERIKLSKKEYYQKNKDKITQNVKAYQELNKEKKLDYDKVYYIHNKNKRNLNKKIWISKNKDWYKEWKKNYRLKQIEEKRQMEMIAYYRKRQKVLTLDYLKNNKHKPYNNEIFNSVPTFALCELLKIAKYI